MWDPFIEQPSLYEHLTGRENLEILRKLKGLERRDADRVIEALDMADYAGNPVQEYSRGMRQRLGIAIAVLGRPDLVLLDEPMNGLDAGGLETFRALVQGMQQEYGTTFLVSSHQLDELDLVATHIGILNGEGDLLFQGTRQELSTRVPQELHIQVDRPGRRKNFGIRWSCGSCTEGASCYLRGDRETAREVNRLLVENSIGVHHLAIELATLEQLFVEVTGAVKAGSIG